MRRHLASAAAAAAIGLIAARCARAESWIFLPSSFTHHPATGERVVQFAPKKAAYARTDPTYLQSVYRHRRSTIRAGSSADHTHVVETWGAGDRIRPYGEWQRPYRAGATPYGPWGNPAGPWTMPFESWSNPYALGPWPYYYGYPGCRRRPYPRGHQGYRGHGEPHHRRPSPPAGATPHGPPRRPHGGSTG